MAGIILFVTILVVGVGSQSDGSTSWGKLKISNRILVSVPYGNFRLNIYEHLDNYKKTNDQNYFYSPIAQLDHKSAASVFNEVTFQNEMRFRIEMWNDKVQSQVVQYLTEFFGRQVTADRVQVVPFEKVALASSTTAQTLYKLSTDWLPYQKSMWFSIPCLLQKDCDQLATDMRTNPNQFDHLKLVYSPTSQTSQTFGTTPLHDIHFVQDWIPTADDWIELTAKNSDLKKELNEMKLAIGILRKELNELKGTFNGSRNPNQDYFETSRRSAETLMRLAETKITVADLRKEVAAALQKCDETTAALTRELNETKATVDNFRKELTETLNHSFETYPRLAGMKRAKLIASNESSDGHRITERPSTFYCKGKADGNYGDPSSTCSSRFYICAHGNVFQRSCPTGTVYRANTLQCDWTYNVPGCG